MFMFMHYWNIAILLQVTKTKMLKLGKKPLKSLSSCFFDKISSCSLYLMKLRQLTPFAAKNILCKNCCHYIIIMWLSCNIKKILTSGQINWPDDTKNGSRSIELCQFFQRSGQNHLSLFLSQIYQFEGRS